MHERLAYHVGAVHRLPVCGSDRRSSAARGKGTWHADFAVSGRTGGERQPLERHPGGDWMPRLTVIEAGRLVDGTGAEPIESARMIVEDGRIREVGPASQVKMPEGDVEKIDASGQTVMPGLLDGHVHLNFSA